MFPHDDNYRLEVIPYQSVPRSPQHISKAILTCALVFIAFLIAAGASGRACAEVVGPFEVEGPANSYTYANSTLTISEDGVVIKGMIDAAAPAGTVVVNENVKEVGIGSYVRIQSLTVKRSTTFIVDGPGNEIVQLTTARADAIGGDGKITLETGNSAVDVFNSATVRVDGTIESAFVWQKATLVLGPNARVDGVITALGGILDLSQVTMGKPIPVQGVSVGNPTTTLAVAAPFGATDLHQLLNYQTLTVNDAMPVYENGEQIGTLNPDGSFNITATRNVSFMGLNGVLLTTETVPLFGAAHAPDVTAPDGYRFLGWSKPFDYVTEDMTISALFEKVPTVVSGSEGSPSNTERRAAKIIRTPRTLASTDDTLTVPIAVTSGAATISLLTALTAAFIRRRNVAA